MRLTDTGHSVHFLCTSKEFGLSHEGLDERGKTCLDLSFLIKEEL